MRELLQRPQLHDNDVLVPTAENEGDAAAQSQTSRPHDKWAVHVPQLLVSTNLTLEKFHALKWREISRLSNLISAPCFRRVRLAGDDHALYESYYRSFPHEMVSKARFTGVTRAVFGVEDNSGVKSTLPAPAVELCRHLEKMKYTFELSADNVLMLNWRLLLVGLYAFQHPLQSMREHLAWGFRVFGGDGFLDALTDTTTIQIKDAALLLTQLMRNQASTRLVSERFRQAQVLQPTGTLTPANIRQRMTTARVTHRHFLELTALAPLRALFEKATDHTIVLEELATPLYRQLVFRTRKKDSDRKKIERLQYFHRTKRLRRALFLWCDKARVVKRTRELVNAAFKRLARVQRAHAFARIKKWAIHSWAATEIQRMVRGMLGRRIAWDKWILVQAAVRVQGAFRMRSHFVQFIKDLRRRNRAAIKIQRVYRGRVGRIKAKSLLMELYYRELELIDRDRQQFREFVLKEMGKRIDRFLVMVIQRRKKHRAAQAALERERVEQEMLEVASEATRLIRRHKQEVTAKYDKLRENHEYRLRRKQIDGAERNKVIRLRRQRQWDAFKAERDEMKERRKRESADAYNDLKARWDAMILERVKRKQLFIAQVMELEEPGEWKSLQKQLRGLVADREKQLQAKYRQSQVVVPKQEVRERAKLEVIDNEVEKERQTAEAEWLQAEADFLYDVELKEEARMTEEKLLEHKKREKSAVLVQSAFRMFAARKRLKLEIRQCFVKEFNVMTQLPMYRNTNVDEPPSVRKPYGLGSDDISYPDQWVLIDDEVVGQPFFFHPETIRQSWEVPDECQSCEKCARLDRVSFAAYWNTEEDTYLCEGCFDLDRKRNSELNLDVYYPYDGSKRGGY